MPGTITDVNWDFGFEDANGVGLLAEVTGTVRIDWGDGTIEDVTADADGDVPDPLFPTHTYEADGAYAVSVRGDGDLVRLRVAAFATRTDDLTLVGSGLGDAILTGSGDDSIRSGAGSDLVLGNAGNDRLAGGAGDDTLSGGDGDDILRGGDGTDVLGGGAGNDRIHGDAGPSVLRGDGGNDLLVGGADGDILIGGTGRDVMTGGAGSDSFYFGASEESAVGGARDVITDFDSTSADGQDVLFLLGLGPLTFITGRFGADGDGEVRAVTRPDRTIVQVDADGNGTVDLEIALLGTQTLDAFNVVL